MSVDAFSRGWQVWLLLNTITAGDVICFSRNPARSKDYGIPYGSGQVLYPAFNQPIQVQLPDSVNAFGFDLDELEPIGDIPQRRP